MSEPILLVDEPPPVLAAVRRRVLLVALVGGALTAWLAFPTLFGGAPIGLGMTLLLMVPVLAVLGGGFVVSIAPSRAATVLLLGALALLPWLAVRAAPGLVALDLAGAFGLVSVAIYRYRSDTPPLSLTDHLRVVAWAPFSVLIQPLRFLRDDLDGVGSSLRQQRQFVAILRGLAIAAIPLVVFGALLASADAVFSNLLEGLFGFDPGGLLQGVGATLFVAWVVIGLLRFALGSRLLVEIPRDSGYLGATEVVTILGSLTLMFTAFVVIQFAYLFGGVDTIEATGGLTRAEYYRQGFFQLVVVAALVVLLVLVLDWWHRPRETRHFRLVLVLFEALIALTGVMVVSALVRLDLYVDSFGLSQLRVYTAALVLWIAVVLVLLGWLVLQGRREHLAPGAIAAAFAVVLALNVVNPDALIARVNIDRHLDRGVELDVGYLSTLSADAVGAIADRATGSICADLRQVAREITAEPGSDDVRTFHWARSQAEHVVAGFAASEGC
jgi:uncharacterized membrane protein YdcZ (DUF606 family)